MVAPGRCQRASSTVEIEIEIAIGIGIEIAIEIEIDFPKSMARGSLDDMAD